MGGVAAAPGVLDGVLHEIVLFAGFGFLIGGADDLATDLVHFGRRLRRRTRIGEADPACPYTPGRLAVFVPAWDESAVIGLMLRSALARFEHPDYRIYAGAYPNDPDTAAAIQAVATQDPRVRLVLCPRPGPTTKADCLNALWHALLADQRAEGRPFKGVVLHDAEDLVHPEELRLLDQGLDHATTVQLPVLPLADPRSRWISGHYIDEFAEAHGKLMPVRQALGAGLPLAGTGCAIAVPMLARIAIARGGVPFDEASLTEDYELGLTIAMLGGRGVFLNVREKDGDQPVGVRAFFPATLDAAVRQKARWMVGIALAGWDRIGWATRWRATDHWMRMRDRRTILAVPVLAAAYVALVGWGISETTHWLAGSSRAQASPALRLLLMLNSALLVWRIAVRAHFVGRRYGWKEGARSMPRAVIANLIALLAARRAILSRDAARRRAALGQDRPPLPHRARRGRGMTGGGRPLKFLLVVLLGWSGARAALLWPGAKLAAPAEATTTPPGHMPRPAAAPRFALAEPTRPPSVRLVAANADLPAPPTHVPASDAPPIAGILPPPPALPAQGRATPAQASSSIEPALALVAQPAAARRWSASAWLVARGGSMAGNGAFGPAQLGGSQAGARLRYALTRSLALSGRLSTPLRGIGREAGLGVEWQPLKLPLSILLERRVSLDSGPNGTALGAITGLNPTRVLGSLELEGYGLAGVVARARREPYADGALRLLQPVVSGRLARLAIGAGLWGGAQRGANRVDVGPSIVATVPTGGPTLRLAAEWRQRVAGNATPGSGPAVTLGTDF